MSALKNKVVLAIIAIALIAIIGYFGWNMMHAGGTQAEKAQAEAKSLSAEVAKIMVVPNETPIVASVEQADTLKKEQPFYANVQNGDKLLIYPQAAKAIIFRESSNMIINAGPVQFQGQQGSQLNTPAPAATTAKPVK